MQDDQFSEKLLNFARLRRIKPCSCGELGTEVMAHAGLVAFDCGSSLIDLRSYAYKPMVGHNHPLLIKYANELKLELANLSLRNQEVILTSINISELIDVEIKPDLFRHTNVILHNSFYTNYDYYLLTKYFDIESDNLYFNFYFEGSHYLINYTQFQSLQDIYKYCSLIVFEGKMYNRQVAKLQNDIIKSEIFQNGLLLVIKNQTLSIDDFLKHGFYVNQDNYVKNSWYLYVPHCLTQQQLEFLINTINKILGE
jgi:hypothetical protein